MAAVRGRADSATLPGLGLDEDALGVEAFLAADFDAASFSRGLVDARGGASEGLAALLRTRSRVEAALSTHVAEHNDELLGRLDGTDDLLTGVGGAKQHASALTASLGRLGRDVSEPFVQLRQDALRLRNVLATCRVLDRTRRFLRAVNKLKAQLGHGETGSLPESGRELAKAAQTLHDIERLVQGMRGIDAVDRERDWLEAASAGVRKRTEMVLNRAITEKAHQSEVAPALQTFFNLGMLPERVDATVGWVVTQVTAEVREALDAHALSEAVEAGDPMHKGKRRGKARIKPPSGQEKEWQSMLWQRIEALEASVRRWSLCVWSLQRVLAKKRDPMTHVLFADLVNADRRETVFDRYWRQMTEAMQGEVERASRAYPFIRSVLGAQDYPKLRNLFRTLPARLAKRTAGKAGIAAGSVAGSAEEVHAVLRALQPLLELFLAQSHRRLKETVEVMFPAKQLPTRNDVNTFAKTMASEIAAAKSDVDLSTVLTRGAGNAVALFASKAEALLASPAPVTLVLQAGAKTTRNEVQAQNVAVLDLVLRLEGLVRELPEKTTRGDKPGVVKAKESALAEARARLRGLADRIQVDYLAAAADALHDVLARVHASNFCSDVEQVGESAYIVALTEAVATLKRDHLEALPAEASAALQARTVADFVHHVAMVRPVNMAGRMRLTNDLAQFELAVEPLGRIPEGPYTELRAMRELLFSEQEAYASLQGRLRATTLWLALFGDAPPELRSPCGEGAGAERRFVARMRAAAAAAADHAGLERLVAGTGLREPRAVKDLVWGEIAASLDKYMQMLSAAEPGAQQPCKQAELLRALRESESGGA